MENGAPSPGLAGLPNVLADAYGLAVQIYLLSFNAKMRRERR